MDDKNANMAARYEREIPEGYEARIDGNKVIIELKESEDERIRKHIIEILERLSPCHWDGNEKSECIAYLEKLKDIDCLACDQHLKGYIAGRKVTEEEKEKEQKPAEWSEEDEKIFNSLCTVLHGGLSSIPTEKFISWLKSHLSQPQKEWNEKDLKWAEEIRLALLYYSNDKPFIEELTNWFNNHIQPNPHWKPSEEQMKALRKASDLLVSDLNSLYNDLTKQM